MITRTVRALATHQGRQPWQLVLLLESRMCAQAVQLLAEQAPHVSPGGMFNSSCLDKKVLKQFWVCASASGACQQDCGASYQPAAVCVDG